MGDFGVNSILKPIVIVLIIPSLSGTRDSAWPIKSVQFSASLPCSLSLVSHICSPEESSGAVEQIHELSLTR